MIFDELTYTVADAMGPPQTLTITADGGVRYESHSSASTEDTPEIGFYETTLAGPEVERLRRAFDDRSFESLPDHRGRIAAGDRYQRIVVSSGDGRIEKMVGTTEPVDPALARLIGELDAVVGSAMQHPRRAIRIDVMDANVDASGRLTLHFELLGRGTEAADLVHPARLAGRPGVWIRGWSPVARGQPQAADTFAVDAETIEETGGGATAAGSFLRLAAGQRRAFRVTAQLAVSGPATYQTQLIYQNTTEYPGGPAVLVGELVSKTFTLEVPTPR
jgi:hypothetical protein